MYRVKQELVSQASEKLFSSFMEAVRDDPRINAIHISLYFSLLHYGLGVKGENPVSVFSHEIMPLCKVSGAATYYRSIRELHEYGNIKYLPSYNHFLGSMVYFIEK